MLTDHVVTQSGGRINVRKGPFGLGLAQSGFSLADEERIDKFVRDVNKRYGFSLSLRALSWFVPVLNLRDCREAAARKTRIPLKEMPILARHSEIIVPRGSSLRPVHPDELRRGGIRRGDIIAINMGTPGESHHLDVVVEVQSGQVMYKYQLPRHSNNKTRRHHACIKTRRTAPRLILKPSLNLTKPIHKGNI